MKTLLAFIFFCSYSFWASAQITDIDPFYPFVFPNISNPANTGHFLKESSFHYLRIQSNSQLEHDGKWTNFQTQLNLDDRLPVFRRDYIGLGVDYKLRKSLHNNAYQNSYNIRAAYHKHMGRRVPHSFSLGLNIGLDDKNQTTDRALFYQQEHGLSWTYNNKNLRNLNVFQLGLSHKMKFLIHTPPDSSNINSWQHWVACQAYAEWPVSFRIRLNVLANYQYRFYGGPNFLKHALGGTIALDYGLKSPRKRNRIHFGLGIQAIGWKMDKNLASLAYNLFLGFQIDRFRLTGHFSIRQQAFFANNRSNLDYQFGLSMAYHIYRVRRSGGVPAFN